MARKAARPLDAGAVRAANQELYRRHPELVSQGKGRQLSADSPQDAALRAEWMDLYVQSGGRAEPVGPPAAAVVKSAIASEFSGNAAGTGISQCPLAAAPPAVPALPPPARRLPPQSPSEPPCELLKADTSCQHGRQPGPERILMVVPDGAANDDTITTKLSMKGGCGSHPSWSYGSTPAGAGKSTSIQFKASTKASVSLFAPQDWRHLSPSVTRISSAACAGISGDCEVRAYPPGKASLTGEGGFSYQFFPSGDEDRLEGSLSITSAYERENISSEKYKLDFLKFIQKFSGAVSEKLVGNSSSGPEPAKAPKSTGKIAVRLNLSGDWEWKEVKGSWKAVCDSTYKFGAVPLLEASGEFPVYGPPIPPKLKKWVDLGLYAGAAGRVSLNAERASSYSPDSNLETVSKWEAKGEGELEFSLFAKIQLVSEDFLSGTVGGKTGLKIAASKAASGAPEIEFKREWTGLKANLSGEAVWGLFSYEREFVLFERYEFKSPWIWKLT